MDEMESTNFLIDPNRMRFKRHLTEGGMSRISLYELGSINTDVSELVVKKSLLGPRTQSLCTKALQEEIRILSKMKHKNIVKMRGVIQTDSDFGFVMEYHNYGSCKDFFNHLQSSANPVNQRWLVHLKIRIIFEVTLAMQYLHNTTGYLHLDLKTENVLLDEELHAKICDFGLSKMRVDCDDIFLPDHTDSPLQGTCGRIAPERILDSSCPPSTKSDVYSFGIMVWELLSDTDPYEDKDLSNEHVLDHIAAKNLRPLIDLIPPFYPPEMTIIITKSWAEIPQERPDFEELSGDLTFVMSSIEDFDLLAEKSSRKALNLHDSCQTRTQSCPAIHLRTQDTTQNSETRTKQPLNQAASVTRIKPLLQPRRTQSSHDIRFAVNVDENIVDNQCNENTPLLATLDVRQKRVFTWKKIALGISVLLSVIAVVAVVIWRGLLTGDCIQPQTPQHGNKTCAKSSETKNMRCDFGCNEGFQMIGKNEMTCSAGKWSGSPPVCERVCAELPAIPHSVIHCTDDRFVNSTCTIKCIDNHIIQGGETIRCQLNGSWTNADSKCVCVACLVGDKCSYSTSWKNVARSICDTPECSTKINYGGHSITCKNGIHGIWQYYGRCTDVSSGISKECDPYDSPSGGQEHAASLLIRDLVNQHAYPPPCDPQEMPKDC